MHLEDLLKQLINAVTELTNALQAQQKSANPVALPAARTIINSAPPTSPELLQKMQDAAVPPALQAAEPANAAETPDVLDIGVEQIKPLVMELHQLAGREAALAVLAEFGAKKLPEVDAVHYHQLYQRLSEALKAAGEKAA